MRRGWGVVVAVVASMAAVAAVAGCGKDASTSATGASTTSGAPVTTAAAAPDAGALKAALLTETDLPGSGWKADDSMFKSPGSTRPKDPSTTTTAPEMCEGQTLPEGLQGIADASDSSALFYDASGNAVVEMLAPLPAGGDAAFGSLKSAVEACFGKARATGFLGGSGVSEKLDLPTLGDDSIASREEPAPGGKPAPTSYSVIGRKGPVLVFLVVTNMKADKAMDEATFAQIVEAANKKLASL